MPSSFGPNLLSLELIIVCDCMFPSTVFSLAFREESPAGPAAATASSNSDAGNPVAVQERHTESGPAELDSPK